MASAFDARQIVRFGPFEVNLRTGELRKRGIRIALQEQPLRILSALIDASGDIVTRQELCRRLWPDGTFVDFEHSLNAAVRRLRVALGDVADIPRFVETVPRRGYRFLMAPPTAHGRLRLAMVPFSIWATDADTADAVAAHTFVDGLMDESITHLARACPQHIAVIARTSVMPLAGKERSASDIGRMLGADYLLQGSVRREGMRVRITALLIESAGETHVWAATYDRTLNDALTVQMEVAEAIAAAVVHSLTHLRDAVGF
jgi:TolB-like protein